VVAGVLPALVPVVHALRETTSAALKDGFGGYAAARGRGGALLIVGEVALAMTLAVAGALLLQSFARLTAVTPGFDTERILSLKVFLGPPRYRSVASEKQYVRAAMDRIASIPGVESVAAVSSLPLNDPSSAQRFDIEGRAMPPSDRPMASYRAVSSGYFSALRIPIVRGRGITDDDRDAGAPVMVVNDAMARRFWPNQDPVGQRIKWATGIEPVDRTWHTIVGVVADVKSSGLDKPEPPAMYEPYTQRVFPWLRWNTFVARTHGAPESYAQSIRHALAGLDPLQPVFQIASLEAVVSQSVSARRFNTALIDLFAALALALCAVGVYGTIGFWVAERTREIGVRMALGASRRRIRAMVVARATAFTGAGVAVGIALSLATGRMLSTLLFDVHPFDGFTIASVSLIVLATGAAAAYVPARRASALDPLTVIRGE
jgi:predicted permease